MKVTLIAAITADGFIGRDSGHTADWTSKEDKKLFVKITKEAGAMVMGSRTFETIGRALPGRRNIVLTSRPEEYHAEGVEFTSESVLELVKRLEGEGQKSLAVCGGANVYHQFMQAGLVSELYLTVEPVLFGSGVKLFSGELDVTMQLVSSEKLNDDVILLHYKVT
nr:dihydrofolate reductase [uncultured bacterium]AIA10821.1 dihydrofolate reductase [uncultured bacterium]